MVAYLKSTDLSSLIDRLDTISGEVVEGTILTNFGPVAFWWDEEAEDHYVALLGQEEHDRL